MPLLNRFVTFTRPPACHTGDLWLVLAGAGRVTSRQPVPISRGQDKRLASVHQFSIFSCYSYNISRTGVPQFQRKNSWVKEIYCCSWDKQISPKFHSFFSSVFYRGARCIFVFLIHGVTLTGTKCRVYLEEDAVHFFAWCKHSYKVVWPVTKRYIL